MEARVILAVGLSARSKCAHVSHNPKGGGPSKIVDLLACYEEVFMKRLGKSEKMAGALGSPALGKVHKEMENHVQLLVALDHCKMKRPKRRR